MTTPTGSPPVQDGLGSSEAAAILGLDSFHSAFDVWRAKVEGITSSADSPMMRWGRLLEDVVAADFAERTGIELHRILADGRQRTLRMKGHPLITCRLDRRTRRRPRWVVEVKTSPYGTGFGEAGEYADGAAGGPEGLPPRIRVQVYHQLAVTGYERAIVAALIGGYQRRDYVVPRDEPVIMDLVAELEDWWATYVVTKTPPPMDGSDGADAYLRERWPRESEDVITATPEQALLAAELKATKASVKFWTEAERLARQKVAEAIGPHAGMVVPGGRITYKAHEVHVTAWQAVADAYRTLVEEVAPNREDPRFYDLPSTIQQGLDDLDGIRDIHTTTRIDRPLKATWED